MFRGLLTIRGIFIHGAVIFSPFFTNNPFRLPYNSEID